MNQTGEKVPSFMVRGSKDCTHMRSGVPAPAEYAGSSGRPCIVDKMIMDFSYCKEWVHTLWNQSVCHGSIINKLFGVSTKRKRATMSCVSVDGFQVEAAFLFPLPLLIAHRSIAETPSLPFST